MINLVLPVILRGQSYQKTDHQRNILNNNSERARVEGKPVFTTWGIQNHIHKMMFS